jgi:Lambda phage tail tube protein, TTP
MANAQLGFKAQLERGNGDGPPETFTAIAGIRDIVPPNLKGGVVDATVMNQADYYKQKVAALIDPGQATFQLAFDPSDTGHKAIISDLTGRLLRNWKIIYPDGTTTWTFAAFVTDVKPKAPLDGLMIADVTLELSGAPTLP